MLLILMEEEVLFLKAYIQPEPTILQTTVKPGLIGTLIPLLSQFEQFSTWYKQFKELVVGDVVVGFEFVGDSVVGEIVVGDIVVGDSVLGNIVVGVIVVGGLVVEQSGHLQNPKE